MIIEKRRLYIQAMLVVSLSVAEENHCPKLLYVDSIGDGSKYYFWKFWLCLFLVYQSHVLFSFGQYFSSIISILDKTKVCIGIGFLCSD